ncbi:type 1 ifn inhibitor [Raccoonpox virus]|uniref:Host-range protein/type I IFN inhibitor n=1 Tax=Raccoon poxvirus TaxID=10256 RepID=A0A0G3G478_RACVI|nr:Host-range protein/type I IFN inhibitor [Raccoonpox virus]AKJ93651.1 Host-range protein/type I IFN inhibitor [Raccoonpox virus]AOP31282.1 type 1 ifn inhibitor [Raccoonpox virus]
MGIQHEFDIIIGDIALRNLQLHKGNNYGCKIKIVSDIYKQLKFRFIIRPDWSEVKEVKGLTVFANKYFVKLNKVDESLHYVIYDAVIHLYSKTTEIMVYSDDNNELFKYYYPYISLNLNNKKFKVKEENYSSPYIEHPLIPYRDYENVE